MRDLSGERLGPYELRRAIRSGGAATVYEAYQSSLNRAVAVKVLNDSPDPDFIERFRMEARSIASLDHPNILPIYDYGDQDGIFYVAVKYVEGGRTVADLTGEPLELAQAVELVGKLLAALGHAHGRGLVHRDVKPSNILLTPSDWPLLADFGIAKAMQEDDRQLTRPGMAVGTPAYMSPEQSLGRPVDARTDLYSAGVVLYELVTGRPPFEADTAEALLVQQAYSAPPPPREINPAISSEVEAFLLRALAKDPAERFQDAESMGVELRTLLRIPVGVAPGAAGAAAGAHTVALAPAGAETLDEVLPVGATFPGAATADSEFSAAATVGGDVAPQWASPSPPPPPQPPSEPSAPGRSRRRRRLLVPSGVAAGVVVLVLIGGLVVFPRISKAEVVLEPASAAGSSPFTKDIAAPGQDEVVPNEIAGDTASGAAPGLYGGTQDQTSCDVQKLSDFLTSDPEKGAAWVAALNTDPSLRWSGGTQVSVDQIPAFLAELTPVLLRQDTRVTNNGYRNGQPLPRQAVLQAGTAILVDQFGVPRTRCACGNPLQEPEAEDPQPAYSGDAWEGFKATRIVEVEPSDEPIEELVVADSDSGVEFILTVGSVVEDRDDEDRDDDDRDGRNRDDDDDRDGRNHRKDGDRKDGDRKEDDEDGKGGDAQDQARTLELRSGGDASEAGGGEGASEAGAEGASEAGGEGASEGASEAGGEGGGEAGGEGAGKPPEPKDADKTRAPCPPSGPGSAGADGAAAPPCPPGPAPPDEPKPVPTSAVSPPPGGSEPQDAASEAGDHQSEPGDDQAGGDDEDKGEEQEDKDKDKDTPEHGTSDIR